MARPIIALVTDFGSRDHYVGAMKGVMLGVCPEATLVDITHDISAHDVLGGALELAAAYRHFPSGTVFLSVVDPGVGTGRLALAAEAGDYQFVAPDNGILSVVLREAAPGRVVELTEPRYARQTVSRTFEGRDRFAPAAAWLAKGVDLQALGRPVHDICYLTIPEAVMVGGGIAGTVLRIDRFGNLVTSIERASVDRLTSPGSIQVWAGAVLVEKVVDTYADVQTGDLCALFGGTDYLEVAVRGGSAAERLCLSRGAAVRVTVC